MTHTHTERERERERGVSLKKKSNSLSGIAQTESTQFLFPLFPQEYNLLHFAYLLGQKPSLRQKAGDKKTNSHLECLEFAQVCGRRERQRDFEEIRSVDVDVYIFVCVLSSLVLRRLVLLLSLFSESEICAGNDRNSIIARRPQIGEKKDNIIRNPTRKRCARTLTWLSFHIFALARRQRPKQ